MVRAKSKMPYVHKLNRRKYKRRFSNLHMLAVTILLAIISSASILAFEWQREFFNSHIFILKGITLQGDRRISSADILDASNLRVGTDSIYSIMPHIIEKRIKARFRYLEQVEVQRRLALERGEGIYGWVTITVKEREPVALVGFGRDADSFMVIDAYGFVLEEGIQSPRGDVPVIVGPITRHASRVTGLALDVLTSARSVIPELFGEISHIDARDPDNITLILDTRWRNPASSIQHPVSRSVTIRIASGRIKEGLSNILPVIIKRKEENKARSDVEKERNSDGETEGQGDGGGLLSPYPLVPLSQNPHISFDARFPGAVYCKVDEL